VSTIAFLGLGSMGSAMAARLIDAGHDVLLWNRSPEAVDRLLERGGRRAEDAAQALAADIALSMLANDEAMDAVLTEEAVSAARDGIHVAMGSISPRLAEDLDTRFGAVGARYIAAPVLGRPVVAAAGKLNILAAGPVDAVDAVAPLLDVLGVRTWRLGSRPAVANAVKAAVNYNIIHAMQAIGETVAMTERLGVDPSQFTTLLAETLFGGVVYSGYGRIIAERAYDPPGFHIALGRKDLDLADQVAAETGVTPATLPALISVFDRALADPELKDLDWSAIAEVSRRPST
jgi:3-hydroxyisobutyrate dehydrogenase-like beta-hydroxyacid dehydrogenase